MRFFPFKIQLNYLHPLVLKYKLIGSQKFFPIGLFVQAWEPCYLILFSPILVNWEDLWRVFYLLYSILNKTGLKCSKSNRCINFSLQNGDDYTNLKCYYEVEFMGKCIYTLSWKYSRNSVSVTYQQYHHFRILLTEYI